MPKAEKTEPWYTDAAELMAQNGISLIEACGELGLDLTTEQVLTIERRRSFARVLWETRHRYFNKLGTDPNLKKDTIIGKLVSLAQRLEDQGAYDKAAEAILKAAKVAGFVGPESTISVFGELSQADLDQIKKKLEEGSTVKGRIN